MGKSALPPLALCVGAGAFVSQVYARSNQSGADSGPDSLGELRDIFKKDAGGRNISQKCPAVRPVSRAQNRPRVGCFEDKVDCWAPLRVW